MNWIIVKKFPLETDLSAVTGYLRQQGFVHQIYEDMGEQVLTVADPAVVEPLLNFLQGVAQGRVQIDSLPRANQVGPSLMQTLPEQIKATPISSVLVALSFLGAFLVYIDPQFDFLYVLTFKRFANFAITEPWRLITPVFLHFGILHVLFNSLWMWDLGRRLEILLGTKGYLIFFVVTAIASNSAQSLWSGSSNFGGMSGVVYALIGFIMVSHRLSPHRLTAVSPGVIVFMLGWLVLCMTGVLDYVVGGGVANAAHVGGLVSGCVAALVTTKIFRIVRD